ncbi:MAG TPA: hypothetical protein VGY30_13285 [Solirubrobacteraceae bacterium]|jgi:hypothetical protein|nr:hypothetical protein [Solirubrobacteraceae bacterium]
MTTRNTSTTTRNRSTTARTTSTTTDRLELLGWTASLGAITAEALSVRDDVSLGSARGRLSAACRRGLLSRTRPLSGRPALFGLTAAGARVAGLAGTRACRVSPSNANHLIECALAAASLERCYTGHRAIGERALRSAERVAGRPLVSARLAGIHGDPSGLHRPDLVLLAPASDPSRPVAVEVELSVKAPRRLRAICRAWARCREVAGVVYLVSEQVEPALLRAVATVHAAERIAVVRLDALTGAEL